MGSVEPSRREEKGKRPGSGRVGVRNGRKKHANSRHQSQNQGKRKTGLASRVEQFSTDRRERQRGIYVARTDDLMRN